MATTDITRGNSVRVKTAFGEDLVRVALSGIVMGSDFQVVWVCRQEEWLDAYNEGRDPEGVPWPVEDVELIPGEVHA